MKNNKEETTKFENALNLFVDDLKQYVSSGTGEWTIKGFIDIYKNIYTISTKPKLYIGLK